jgi:hypothetical protein
MAFTEVYQKRAASVHDAQPRTEAIELREALKALHDLLEDFAPSWYAEEIRDRAKAALLFVQ